MNKNKVEIRDWIPTFVGMTIVGIILLFLLGNKKAPQTSQEKKILVTASFYPLAYIAERVGGEFVSVTTLTPAGAEPHDFEPNTRDIAKLEKQDIILLNGGGLEGYAKQLIVSSQQSTGSSQQSAVKTQVILVGEQVMSDKKDPHVWIDPVLYAKEVDIITAALIKIDPRHSQQLTVNSQQLIAELESLDNEFKKGLQNCTSNTIITTHSAFAYLAKRYNLNQVSLVGLSPEEEPSARALADTTTFARKNNIRYIFFEKLVNPALAETLAHEVGAKTLVLNPIEGLTKEDVKNGKTYISIQRENLENLRIALECTVETGFKPVSTNSE